MTLNIDELVLENDLLDEITTQVDTILETHGQSFPTGYALSWVIANQVVQRYYGTHGLDALPVWRENFGWTQFNLIPAQNCFVLANPADETQRYISFDAIAVNWRKKSGGHEGQYDVTAAMLLDHHSPFEAINGALAHLELDSIPNCDHSFCLHSHHAYTYTKLFDAVTNLICQAPEMVAKRELVVDLDVFNQPLPEAQHPLRRSGLAEAGVHQDWFELFYVPANRRMFVNIFTGDLCYTQSDETVQTMEYPGWNELNEEQLTTYLGSMLGVPESRMRL